MNSLTVKDFIHYFNTCINCESQCNIEFINVNSTIRKINKIKPFFEKDTVNIRLKNNYHNKLDLCIYYITNKFSSNNFVYLKKYLLDSKLYIEYRCTDCKSIARTNSLSFDHSMKFIKPISVQKETILIKSETDEYTIQSNYIDNTTIVFVNSIKNKEKIDRYNFSLIKRPFSKEEVLKKIKSYILFS